MPLTAPITDANPNVEQMQARVARFAAFRPTADYVDAAIPGCERTTFRVLGATPDALLRGRTRGRGGIAVGVARFSTPSISLPPRSLNR